MEVAARSCWPGGKRRKSRFLLSMEGAIIAKVHLSSENSACTIPNIRLR